MASISKISNGEGEKRLVGVESGGYVKVQQSEYPPNDDRDLQPLVKGKDLANGLKQLADLMNALNGILVGFMNSQMAFNRAIMKHHHYSPFFGKPTTAPWDTLMPQGVQAAMDQVGTSLADLALPKTNLPNWKFNYCEPAGSLYFNSRMNNTN